MQVSKIGLRNHIEVAKKHVSYKWNDLLSFNVGTSKMSEEIETSCYSLHIQTSKNDFHITLSKEDAKKMIDFFIPKLLNQKA